jgi:hypothetical protein
MVEPQPRHSGANAALIDALRKEASEVKDCAAKYSFQGMMFIGGVLAALATLQRQTWTVSLACIPLVFVLRAIAKTCVHKYATSNRNLGFELHLERHVRIARSRGEEPQLPDIGWEEGMRAWRVVQATVFNTLYETSRPQERIGRRRYVRRFYLWLVERVFGGSGGPNYRKKTTDKDIKSGCYCWFAPGENLVAGTKYHAGVFLKSTLKLLHVLTWLSALPLLVSVPQAASQDSRNITQLMSALYTAWPRPLPVIVAIVQHPPWFVFLAASCYTLLGFIRREHLWDGQRQNLLENELLSIHSCSIMWHAVVVAHFRAHEATVGVGEASKCGGTYEGYTRNLSLEAMRVKENAYRIHNYIDERGADRSQRRNAPRRNLRSPWNCEISRDAESDRSSCQLLQVSMNGRGALVQVDQLDLAGREPVVVWVKEKQFGATLRGERGERCFGLELNSEERLPNDDWEGKFIREPS